MIGYPGAGKTTFAKQFCAAFNVTHLCADQVGVALYKLPTFSEQERQQVLNEMSWQCLDHLQDGLSVLYDANINTGEERQRLRDLAEKSGVKAIGIWIDTPPTLSEKRLKEIRTVGNLEVAFFVPKNRPSCFEKVVALFEDPSYEEDIVKLSGTASFESQSKILAKALGAHGVILG